MKNAIGPLALILALAISPSPAADDEPAPPFDVLHLSGTVHMLRSNTEIGNPSTVVSAGPEGTFLVDPNLDLVASELGPTLERLGPGPIRFATASHYHGDHTENFELLAREVPGATLFVPHAQRERLATGQVFHGERPLAEDALPPLTFEGKLTLHLNGEQIDVMTLPNPRGHTDGDAVVYFHEANVLYVGDYFFLDRYPVIDESGNLEGYLANVEYLLKSFPKDCTVVPGHGRFHPVAIEAATLSDYRRHHRRIEKSIAHIRLQLKTDKTDDEIVAVGLPETFADLGERPRFVSEERWIRFVAGYYRRQVGD